MRVGIGLSVAVALLFIVAPDECLRLFVHDEAVLRLGAPLLIVGAAFRSATRSAFSTTALYAALATRAGPSSCRPCSPGAFFLPAAYVGGAVFGVRA
jgi:Na+-driven multidrug efflux pump